MGIIQGVFNISCDTDGGTSIIGFQDDAFPIFQLNNEYPTISNLNQLSLANHSDLNVVCYWENKQNLLAETFS